MVVDRQAEQIAILTNSTEPDNTKFITVIERCRYDNCFGCIDLFLKSNITIKMTVMAEMGSNGSESCN